jgi:hypothetical protein
MRRSLAFSLVTSLLILASCAKHNQVGIIRQFPLDDMTGVIYQSNAQIDKTVSADGRGSLKIETTEPITVPIFEINDLKIDNAKIFYQAKVRTKDVIGQVYLEMLCHFPNKGEFFSRGQETLLTGTTEWTSQEIPFVLQKGEIPDIIKLNLVINGHGTVWVDDIALSRGPLTPQTKSFPVI